MWEGGEQKDARGRDGDERDISSDPTTGTEDGERGKQVGVSVCTDKLNAASQQQRGLNSKGGRKQVQPVPITLRLWLSPTTRKYENQKILITLLKAERYNGCVDGLRSH